MAAVVLAPSIYSFHRCGHPLRLVANQQGSYDNCARCQCHMFLNIKRNILYSILHLPPLWYLDTSITYPQWLHAVKFVVIWPHLILQQYLWNIAIQPAVGCYNPWANLRCLSSPLGEKSLWNGTTVRTSAATALTYQERCVLVFHEEGFQVSAPSQCCVMIEGRENANTFLCFSTTRVKFF